MPDILFVFMQGDVTTWVKEHLRLFPVGGKIDISERSLWGSLLIKGCSRYSSCDMDFRTFGIGCRKLCVSLPDYRDRNQAGRKGKRWLPVVYFR